MSWRDCVEDIVRASGKEFRSDAEKEDFAERVASKVNSALERKLAQGLDRTTALKTVGQELRKQATLQGLQEARQAADNVLKMQGLKADTLAGDEFNSVRARLGGTEIYGGLRGRGIGVFQEHAGVRAQMLGPMLEDLKEANVLKTLRQGDPALDRQVAREMARLNGAKVAASADKHVAKMAEILGRTVEQGRQFQNAAGGWINKLEGYIVPQNHDMLKIAKAGREQWIKDVLPLLDREKSYDGHFSMEALDNSFRGVSTGKHEAMNGDAPSGLTGPGNLAKKISQDRSLIFKGPDEWATYNEKYGKGSLLEAVTAQADRAARNTALMRSFGNNPEMMFNRWMDDNVKAALDRGDTKMAGKLQGGQSKNLFDVVSGLANVPGSASLASMAANARTVSQMIHLGGIIASVLTDVPANVAALRHMGVPILEAWAHQLRSIIPLGAAEKHIAGLHMAGNEAMVGSLIHSFRTAEDSLTGKMSRAVEVFHRLNGLTYWTDHQKIGMAAILTRQLGREAGKEFDKLSPLLQTSLRRFKIEGAEWDQIRSAAAKAEDGRVHLLPREVADPELSLRLMSLVTDTIAQGMTEPTALARARLTGGLKSGTGWGEAIRTATQFKSFTATFMERTIGRELQRGRLPGQGRASGIDVPGIIHLVAGLTLMGYAQGQLRALLNGQTPAAPKDAAGWTKVAKDAMVSGGAMGFFGDLFLRQSDNPLADLALGPIFGDVGKALIDAQRVAAGSKTKTRGQIAATSALSLAHSNMPNHPLLKLPMDYLLYYHLQNLANPGYLQRYEKRVRDADQTFWLRPQR